MSELFAEMEVVLWVVGWLAAGILLGWLAHWLLWIPIKRWRKRTETMLDDAVAKYWRAPARLTMILLTWYLLLPFVQSRLGDEPISMIKSGLVQLTILAVAWFLIKSTSVLEAVLLQRYRMDVSDNLQARRIHTQSRILKRLLTAIIVVLAAGMLLMSIDKFRELGTGILASAGIAGLVVGLAAQKTLGNFIAGIQIAIAQPIRIDDVVIVEGEWGRIEEISLTYVVVRIWDLRRLILPISYFLEKPFQNWTRVSADLLGTVYLYLDYRVPVEKIRAELQRLLEASDDWDKAASGVLVTNADSRTIEVRALMSAADSGKLWTLRCHIREKLIEFLRKEYPETLPRARVELTESGDSSEAKGAESPHPNGS